MLTQSPMFQQSVGVFGGGTQLFSYVQLFATPWTVACQAPLSTGFSRQEYRRRLPLNLCFLCLLNWQADFLPLCQLANLFACICVYIYIYMKVKVTQLCLWLFVTPWTGILQARILEWVGIPFSWMLGAGALGRPRGRVWGGRRSEGSGWGARVYLWRIHFDVWQN